MVKHIVCWRLQDEFEGKNKEELAIEIKTALESLRTLVPTIRLLEVGINRDNSDMASDIVLYSEFDSWEGLHAYQVHPEHVKFKEFVQNRRTERRVVDYEV